MTQQALAWNAARQFVGRLGSYKAAARAIGGLLARVYPFAKWLPMMHRDGWDGHNARSAMAFAWFVWEAGHRGRTEIQRIAWEPTPCG